MIENRKLYNHILDKIDEVDTLLNDDEILNNYIIDIENSKINVPILLDSKIKEKINEEIIKNNVEDDMEASYIRPKYSFINILKVACFTLIVMVSWFGMKNIIIENKVSKIEVKEVNENNSLSIIFGKVNEYTNMFSSLLLNPIGKERGNF